MDDKNDFNLAGVVPSTGPSGSGSGVSTAMVSSLIGTQEHRSTGPRTRAGKMKSAKNALKEGFFSREILQTHLRKQDRKPYLKLLSGYIEEHRPIGISELPQVEIMVFNMHQEKRLMRLMSVLSGNSGAESVEQLLAAPEPDPSGYLEDLPNLETLEKLQRCESHVLRNFYRAKAELERLQNLRSGDKVPPLLIVEVNQ